MKKKIKKRIFSIGAILLIGVLIFLIYTYDSYSQSKGRFIYPSGPLVGPEEKEVLSAEEIMGLEPDYNKDIPMEFIINGTSGYGDLHDTLFSLLKSAHKQGWLPYEDSGCYISLTPILFWSATFNQVSTEMWVVVFSENFDETVKLEFYYYENSLSMHIYSEFSSMMLENFRSRPNEKYVCIFNGGRPLMLDSENSLYGIYGRVPVEGDYYHALDYEKLGVSYEEIISQDNLFWVDFFERRKESNYENSQQKKEH
ncbi:MAG: hypothetical protein J1E83_04890 [Lachnospiraceae bacterium]|nr:hypothetical protein [Lachnospiraceae bacterium]